MLFVRLFVLDYANPGEPTPGVQTCTVPSTLTSTRIAECDLDRICPSMADEKPYILEAVVADRQFLDTYRTVPEGSGISSQWWSLTCETEN